jgi:hypothetical protein
MMKLYFIYLSIIRDVYKLNTCFFIHLSSLTNKKEEIIMQFLEEVWRVLIIRTVLNYQKWKCSQAKIYLLRRDRKYRSLHSSSEIVRQRNSQYEIAVSPLAPSVPDICTMEEELPSMAWPHNDLRL